MSNLTNNTNELRDILVAINALPKAGSNSGIIPNGTKEIEKNGEYDVTNYAKANVNVPSKEPVLQEGSATPTKSQQTFEPPSGVDGFSEFVVEPIPVEYIVPEGTGEITNNGKFYVARYEMVNVNVPDIPAVTEELSVIKNGTWEPSAGVDGFSKVTVNVPDIPAVVCPLEVAENGTYIAPVGVDGYSPIVVDVKPATDELTITENCTRIAADEGLDGYSKVIVNVPETTPVIQPLEVNENNVVLTPPDGVDGYSPITVNVPVENLDEEINEQSELIEVRAEYLNELLTVLDGKAAGGNSGVLEMCTLRVVGAIGESPSPAEAPPVDNARILSVLYPYVKTTGDGNGNLQHALAWKDEYVDEDYVEIEGVVVGHPLVISWITDVSETSILEPVNAECLGLSQASVFGLFMCTKANDTAVITVVNGV